MVIRLLLLASLTLLFAGCGEERATVRSDVSIFVSCDTNGWIVPCGCSAGQSGGLVKRASLFEKVATQDGSRDSTLILDVGGAASGVSDYHRLKLEAILNGELAMGLAVHNIGRSEAEFGVDVLRNLMEESSVPFVSANIRDGAGELIAPAYRIVESGQNKFAVIGVLDPGFKTGEIEISDPKQAVLDAIATIDGQADAVIVLAYLKQESLEQLARQVPEADLVLGGPTGQTIAPSKPAATWLASTTNKGKFVIHFRYMPNQDSIWDGEILEVSDDYAEDVAQVENLKEFYDVLGKADLLATETGLTRQIKRRQIQGKQFAGNANCRSCHVQDCSHWSSTKHAHAWDTLSKKFSHVDPYCQQCHTTGYGQTGGFMSVAKSKKMVNVGCESCHGPSVDHSANPKVRTTMVAADSCVGCHDRENSPAFNYDEYWKTITHGVKVSVTEVKPNPDQESTGAEDH